MAELLPHKRGITKETKYKRYIYIEAQNSHEILPRIIVKIVHSSCIGFLENKQILLVTK
jgi:hypothetical protein